MIKVGSNQPPMPPMDPTMMGGDPNAMGGEPMMDDPNAMGGDPMMGEDPNAMGGETSPFDSNFDAGVEADEDTDPKKYIQQLTGKLSQTLNTYEDKEDEGLYKYVGKMILKQTAKNLDDSGRKSLIKAINMVDSDNEDESDEDLDMGGEAPEEMGDEPTQMMEHTMSKRRFKRLSENIGVFNKENEKQIKTKRKPKSPFNWES